MKNLSHLITEAKKYESVEEFTTDLNKQLQSIFPKSYVNVYVGKGIGAHSIYITTTLYGKSNKYPNGIMDNDPMLHTIIIHDAISMLGDLKDAKLAVDSSRGGSITIKPDEGSYMAFGRLKTGWRKFSLTPEKITPRLVKYFKNVKKIASDNIDQFTDRDIEIAKTNLK